MKWWEQPWLGHAITILTVIATQLFAIFQIQKQVTAQARAQRDHELWKLKYEAYAQALDLTTRYMYSREWTAGQAKHRFSAEPPSAEEYGQVYAKLRLLTDHAGLVSALMSALGADTEEGKPGMAALRPVEPQHFHALVRAMREDLGKAKDPTPDSAFALIDFEAVVPTGPENKQMQLTAPAQATERRS